MRSCDKYRFYLSLVITSTCVAISYEIRDFYIPLKIPPIAVAIASFIIATFIADLINNLIFKFKWLRKVALGRTWVEGCWYLQTFDEKEKISNALFRISYVGSQLDLKAVGYHLTKEMEEVESRSITLAVLENLRYVNYFRFVEGKNETFGFASGDFDIDRKGKYPTTYKGIRVYIEEGKVKKVMVQEMSKLTNSELKKYHRKYGGSDWRKHFIQDKDREKKP